MYFEGSETLNKAAEPSLAFLRHHGITPTPQNYEIAFEYHLGRNADLTRIINIMLSNRHVFDDEALARLYRRYFSSEREEQALREASSRIQDNLRELSNLAASSAGDANRFELAIERSCKEFDGGAQPVGTLLSRLLQDAQEMARRSQRLGQKLKQSGEKIDVLEKTLSEARQDAAIDGLTGVANRKAFDMSLRELAGHAMNSGNDLSLLLLDVDHFKRVNDTWGHQTGDDVLRMVARTVRERARAQDRPARYGGEEFAVILPDTTLEQAGMIADDIRRSLEQTCFVAQTAPDIVERVTVSLGGACYEPGEPLTGWLQRTDRALYRAKRDGRNRVVLSC